MSNYPILNLISPAAGSFQRPLQLLIDCHRRIERFLQVLTDLAKTGAGKNLDVEQRQTLTVALDYFRHAAPKHTRDEEESLFPRLQNHAQAQAALASLARLEDDHRQADLLHQQCEQIGRIWVSNGQLSEQEQARFVSALAQLQAIYQQHVAVEEDEVFPLAGRILPEEQLRQVGVEMARRRGLDSHGRRQPASPAAGSAAAPSTACPSDGKRTLGEEKGNASS